MHLVDAVLFGADDLVTAWVMTRLPGYEFGPCVALGVVRDEALIGGVVFSGYQPRARDIEISAAFETAAWFRPRTVARIFRYPFGQLDCARLTLRTARRNRAARRFADKAGFRVEGVCRRGFDGRQDLMLYGMLREECRFVRDT